MININSVKFLSGLFALVLFGSILEYGSAKKFCGSALDDVLTVVCDGVFNKMLKRSGDLDGNYNDISDDLPYPYTSLTFLNKLQTDGASILAKTRRRRHGIYDECCRKGCNYQELLSYCAF